MQRVSRADVASAGHVALRVASTALIFSCFLAISLASHASVKVLSLPRDKRHVGALDCERKLPDSAAEASANTHLPPSGQRHDRNGENPYAGSAPHSWQQKPSARFSFCSWPQAVSSVLRSLSSRIFRSRPQALGGTLSGAGVPGGSSQGAPRPPGGPVSAGMSQLEDPDSRSGHGGISKRALARQPLWQETPSKLEELQVRGSGLAPREDSPNCRSADTAELQMSAGPGDSAQAARLPPRPMQHGRLRKKVRHFRKGAWHRRVHKKVLRETKEARQRWLLSVVGGPWRESKHSSARGSQGISPVPRQRLLAEDARGPGIQVNAPKFLLAWCTVGRLNNQLVCMRDQLRLAQALNRTLIVPSFGSAHDFYRVRVQNQWQPRERLWYQFHWDSVVDWRHVRECVQSRDEFLVPALTLDEYLHIFDTAALPAARLRCAQAWDGSAMQICTEQIEALLALHNGTLPLSVHQVEKSRLGKPPWTPQQFLAEYKALDAEILCVGEMFHATGKHYIDPMLPRLQPLPPPHSQADSSERLCPVLWMPQRRIQRLVELVISEILGANYLALHLRRGDFYYYFKGYRRFKAEELEAAAPSISRVARDTAKRLVDSNLSSLYVATDARPFEIEYFKSLLAGLVPNLKYVVTLHDVIESPAISVEAKAVLTDGVLPSEDEVTEALVDKFVCVRSTIFVGSDWSTFSEDITELRLHGGY